MTIKPTTLFAAVKCRALLLTLMLAVAVQASAQKTIVLGNCTESLVSYQSVSKSEPSGSAFFCPAAVMEAYKGNAITQVSLALASKAAEGDVEIFLSYDIGGEPFYTQACGALNARWNTVKLTTPYTIDGSALYIGYRIKSAAMLSYASTLAAGEEWLLSGGGTWALYDGRYSAALYATVSGSKLNTASVRLGDIYMPRYAVKGEPILFTGSFANLGSDKISSITFELLADGSVVDEETVDGMSVAARSKGTFSLTSLALPNEGDYDVEVRIKDVGGVEDAVAADNVSRTVRTVCRESFTPRKVLLEVFSTERCTECPGAHDKLNPLVDAMDDVVELDHHAGFYTDDYSIDESVALEWFYRQYNVYAPAMMLDRTNFGDGFPDEYSDGVPVISASESNLKIFHKVASMTPALYEVHAATAYDESARRLRVDVSGRRLLDVGDAANVRVFVYLKEDNIYSTSQAGASQGFTHRHTARKSLTPTWGEAVGDGAESFALSYDTDIPVEWKEKDMSVVAFVAGYNADDKNDCRVYNTCQSPVCGVGSGLVSVTDGTCASCRWTVMSASGTLMATGEGDEALARAVAVMPSGVYVIKKEGKTYRCGR